jgi:hypothetical protein
MSGSVLVAIFVYLAGRGGSGFVLVGVVGVGVLASAGG